MCCFVPPSKRGRCNPSVIPLNTVACSRFSACADVRCSHDVIAFEGMWMYDEALFRSGYALLEKYNLSFDAWIYYKQIPAVVRLVSC